MRDLVLKNLTTKNKSRKILCATETINEEGVTTKIRKHLIYGFCDVPKDNAKHYEVFVTRIRNSNLRVETFFIKVKGWITVNCKENHYTINYIHSLRINSSPTIPAAQ